MIVTSLKSIRIFVMVFALLQALPVAASQEANLGAANSSDVVAVLEGATNIGVVVEQHIRDTDKADWNKLIDAERNRLLAVLRAKGYLASSIEIQDSVLGLEGGSTPQSRKLSFEVRAGPLYVTSNVELNFTSRLKPDIEAQLLDVVAVGNGQPTDEQNIKLMAKRLQWVLGQNGYPNGSTKLASIEPAIGESEAAVFFDIDAGAKLYFSNLLLDDLFESERAFIVRLLPFAKGELYSVEKLEIFRSTLIQKSEFQQVRVDVLTTAPNEFSLKVKLRNKNIEFNPSAVSTFGIFLLILTLVVVAIRQIRYSGESQVKAFSLFNVITAAFFFVSLTMAMSRVLTFI